jgi:SEC-C motif-containing protein
VTCVCGAGESLETCCGPYLAKKGWPKTAEALMRARYTAYAEGNVDFIAEWLGLEILATEFGGENDEAGSVEFLARYKLKGVTIPHRERAQFEKKDGKWYFVDGKEISAPPVRHEGPRTGRNDPCPCGSGKKFKKCCGKAA